MAIKLKSLFRGPLLALVLKVLVFIGLLALLKIGDFGIIPILFFLIVSAVLYGTPLANLVSYLTSFIGLTFLALLVGFKFSSGLPTIIYLGIFAVLFYWLLGLKNLFFIYRERWHYLLFLGLIYLSAWLFLAADKSTFYYFLGQALSVFILYQALFWEFLKANRPAETLETPEQFSSLLPASIFALLTLQAFWAISLLPLVPINAANLALLITFALSDLLKRSVKGELSPQIILTNITILVLATLIIFAASEWTI